ncbi:MAG: hypothetical protein HY982_02375 [Candidatus Magasanikbacteria bacterium]|nr:hypothetical protein [Candidatus Magasanikbacteria bacterium]
MNKKVLIIVIVLALLFGAGVWFWRLQAPSLAPSGASTPSGTPGDESRAVAPLPEDTTVNIEKDLEDVRLLDVDKEFQDIDKVLESL